MNVDDMTDEEFIDYCRNGGELSGLITERHPKCDWCGGSVPGSARMACAGTVVSGNGVEPTPSMRSICVIWRIGGTLVIVRNAMSMHAGTG